MSGPVWFWTIIVFLLGICIGSYLNVVIYRLPLGLSTADPAWSFCPNCRTRLTFLDLFPLISFLLLGRKCRTCKQPISWRYFSIELMTGLLFAALFLRFQNNAATVIAMLLFAAVLVPIYFIDLATFEIDDSLNLILFVTAVGRDLWGIFTHEAGYVLLWGWLPRSLAGAALGVLIFGAIRLAGWLWKRQEAMGLGDVLLARGMGAMLALLVPAGASILRLFPIWILLACLSGLIVGPALIFFRRRTQIEAISEETDRGNLEAAGEEIESDESSIGRELQDIGYCLILGDAWGLLRSVLRREPAPAEGVAEVEDDWQPAPTAIPFGPFLVIGFLATVFIGEWLTWHYLAFAFPKPPMPPY
jgi:leader peptidase (prepilin peptidase)/N-methyltransferase